MLELALGIELGVARQVNLAVLADDCTFLVDQNRRVVAMDRARLLGQLGEAEVEGEAQLLGRREERLGLVSRHGGLEPAVDLGLVLHVPAGKEGGQRQLGKDDEVTGLAVGLLH